MPKKDDIDAQMKKLIKQEVDKQLREHVLTELVQMLQICAADNRDILKEIKDCLKVLSHGKLKVAKHASTEMN